MRVLTVLSGTILCGVGIVAFASYVNAFSGLAWLMGMALMVAGAVGLLTYIVSGRKNRLPDTVLVEALVNFFIGFAVLQNQVQEAQITTFFGLWMLVAGATRVSQSFAVSRINPKNWFAVMPMGILCTVYGAIMIMPSYVSEINAVSLTAFGYILNGFSLIIYAMYMVRKELSQKAIEAKERAEIKRKQNEEKRAKRDAMRKLSKDERIAEMQKEREYKKSIDALRREKRNEEKAAERASRNENLDTTMQLKASEVEEINLIAESAPAPTVDNVPQSFDDLWAEADKEAEEKLLENAAKPSFNKPVDIPSVRNTENSVQTVPETEIKQAGELLAKRAIVNLEEIENYQPEVKLPEVELPSVDLAAEGGEAGRRSAFLLEIDETEPGTDESLSNFTPLTLEELFSDEEFNIKPLRDKKSEDTDLALTRTFTFDWLNQK